MPITDLEVLSVGREWPPACDASRMKSYTDNRALLSGAHDAVFDDIVRLIRRDRRRTVSFIALGYPRRIAKAFADMVLGEAPAFKATGTDEQESDDESVAQEQVEAYVEEMDLVHEAYQSLIDLQALGDGLLKVSLEDRGVAGLFPDINAIDPCIWYPVVSPEDKQEVVAHILAWTWVTGSGQAAVTHLRAEVHEPGQVTTYVGTIRGGKVATLALAEETDESGAAVPNPYMTGVDDLLVVPMHNFRSTADCTGVSDYTDLAPILQEMEVRLYLIASILDKHSDPKLYGPRSLVGTNPVTGEQEVAQTDFVPLESDERPPGYVTWEGQLKAAYEELDWLAERALFVMEASPALFGDISGNVASGAALKRLLIAPIMKASRLKSRLDVGLKKALKLASLLHNSVDASAVVFSDIDIMWKDGLPDDELEQANIHATLKTAGLESVPDAVRALFDVDGPELQARLDRLAEEAPTAPASLPPRIALPPLPGEVVTP